MSTSLNILVSALTIYFVLVIHALRFGLRSILNRVFLLATISILLWTLNNILIFYGLDSETCTFWYRYASVGQCFYSSFILHFYIVFTGKKAIFKGIWAYILYYLPSVILFYGFLTENVIVKEFVVSDNGLKSMAVEYSFWFFYYAIVHFGYLLTGFFITAKWISQLIYSFEKNQAKAILVPFIMSMVFGVSIGLFSVFNVKFDLFMLLPVTALFGTAGTWFATVKYKYMVLTPSIAADGILNTMADSVVLVDSDLKILTVNEETLKMLKYDENELIGQNIGFIFDKNDEIKKPEFNSLLQNGMIRNCEALFAAQDSSSIPVSFSASEFRDKNNALVGTIVISRDITDQKKAEESLKHIAHHDFLTGLPNRFLFNNRLEQAILRANQNNTLAAVLLLDIDRFKGVNDVFGHNIGDSLLVEVAARLKNAIRHMDTIARFGGDEFICIINDLKSRNDINDIAEKILQIFQGKYNVGLNELTITASIGVSLYPNNGDCAEILIKNADIAMYHAKNKGKNNYQVYTQALGVECSEKLLFENRLRKAVEQNEFVVYYQPIVDVNSGKVISMEALVRWQHPEKGLIPPMEFIPVAEECGLIIQIGEFVMRTACRQNSQWIKKGLSGVPVSVNLSTVQFQQNNLIEMVLGILDETGLDASYLQMEITESTAMNDPVKTLSYMNQLHDRGINFIVDDFGIGYSSLNYLKSFPVSMIKIDKYFIRNVTSNTNDAAIVTALFAMAQTMDIKVIAEGVETLEQLEFLRSLQWKPLDTCKCYGVQGYYFSKPVPAEIFTDLLEKQKTILEHA